ncbi:cbb3-type cytochrome c oxidase subunit I [Halobaculum sp. P14]|uniref:cbb3-type cytochrome c oxidase subunit I n=1 Tax=Halobaculum sp. P14 TaxID=3421638 RepID=UPI003EBAB3EA
MSSRAERLVERARRAARDAYHYAPDAVPSNPTRWLTTLHHRDIGVLYLAFAATMGLWGALDAMLLRAELVTPQADVWGAATYNALFTTHGLTMLFLFATPALFGFANVVVPPLVGADDMAFPRVNAVAFWLLPPAALLMRAGLIAELAGAVVAPDTAFHPPAVGWTLYPPLSVRMPNVEVDLLLLGIHLSGVSTVAAAINFVVTVVEERGDDVPWASLDIFSWTMLTTAGIALFAFPMLGSSLLMLLLDRNFGTTFFAVGGGGPILWQHLFWFFGHPEVYILVLPAMGVLSTLIPRFSGRKLFGFTFVVYSTLAIGVLSFGVWAHHMFATGIDPRLQASFMAVSLAIAVPSAVKTFNWIATMWNGRIRLTAPMLFCVGAVFFFVLGGVSGVLLAAVPVDRLYHDTYVVVGHFHLLLVGVTVYAAFAASYYWFPLLTGRWYDRGLAKLHFWTTSVGVFVAFDAMFVVGAMGGPRRYATYLPRFAPLHQLVTVFAFVLGVAQLLWLWNVLRSAVAGDPVTSADPWDLAEHGQYSREWAWFAERRRARADAAADATDDDAAAEPPRATHPTTSTPENADRSADDSDDTDEDTGDGDSRR